QDEVTCVTFSPDGKRIVTAGHDGIIKIWDAASGSQVMKLTGHSHRIWDVSFSSDGMLLVSAGMGNTIKVWDAKTGSMVTTLRGHDGPIASVAFSPDDIYLVSSSDDCTVRIWDVATGEEKKTLRGHEDIVRCAVFALGGKQVVSGGWDSTIKVWDVDLDREVSKLLGHKGWVQSIEFSRDGKRLVSYGDDGHGNDGRVKVWDAASCAEVMTLRGEEGGLFGLAAFSPDGKRIASLCGRETPLKIWDAETGTEVATLGGQEELFSCLAFSPDSERIVSGSTDGKIKVWNLAKGEEIMRFGKGAGVLSVVFSPDGRRIASCGFGTEIKVWDAASGAELMSLIGHGPIITCVVFSPDGKRIASSCQEDGTARIWDAATGKELLTLRGHSDITAHVAFSPDGKRVVTGGRDRTARVWDSSTGDELLTLRDDFAVMQVAFSPDGKTIAGSTWGKSIVLWDSTEPADGYKSRKTTATARRIIDKLYGKLGLYHDVIDELKSDKTLDEHISKVALQIANSRKCEDAEKLNKEGWEVVSSPGKDMDAYKSALQKAEKAMSLEPKTLSIHTTLGVGQYRVGAYVDALETLTNAEKMRTEDNLESDPTNVAFTAMTQYQSNQIDKGKSAINTFRDKLEKIRFTDITSEKHSYWIEAEKVFAGTNEQLLAIWELINTKKLDQAVEMFAKLQPPSEDVGSHYGFSLKGIVRYLSRACYARGKSRLVDEDQGYINRVSDYEVAISVDPNYVSALKDLAWLRATCSIEEVKDPTRAVESASRACKLTDWKDHECLSVLAGACSENGEFEDAVKWQKKAIELLPPNEVGVLTSKYENLLKLYRSDMPYHERSSVSFSNGELVAQWNFDEIEDQTVLDSSGNGLNGKLVGSAEITEDTERGAVLRLDGNEGYVDCGDSWMFDITGSMTVSAWIKVKEFGSSREAIISKGDGSWRLARYGDENSIEFACSGVSNNDYGYIGGDENINDSQWHHIAGVYDGKEISLYIDGMLDISEQATGYISSDQLPVLIGAAPDFYDRNWNGLIDDVRIYSRALTAEEISELYQSESVKAQN
ncbi:MAG: LamG-like jellyroll fold domain-containing protein, partial [Planctomycetota bacterium]